MYRLDERIPAGRLIADAARRLAEQKPHPPDLEKAAFRLIQPRWEVAAEPGKTIFELNIGGDDDPARAAHINRSGRSDYVLHFDLKRTYLTGAERMKAILTAIQEELTYGRTIYLGIIERRSEQSLMEAGIRQLLLVTAIMTEDLREQARTPESRWQEAAARAQAQRAAQAQERQEAVERVNAKWREQETRQR